MITYRTLYFLYIVFYLLNLSDAIMTYYGLSVGAVETNPFMQNPITLPNLIIKLMILPSILIFWICITIQFYPYAITLILIVLLILIIVFSCTFINNGVVLWHTITKG
jgi:hypothetical protein